MEALQNSMLDPLTLSHDKGAYFPMRNKPRNTLRPVANGVSHHSMKHDTVSTSELEVTTARASFSDNDKPGAWS